jgi:hypothetical protein
MQETLFCNSERHWIAKLRLETNVTKLDIWSPIGLSPKDSSTAILT